MVERLYFFRYFCISNAFKTIWMILNLNWFEIVIVRLIVTNRFVCFTLLVGDRREHQNSRLRKTELPDSACKRQVIYMNRISIQMQ